mgnify:FL=1
MKTLKEALENSCQNYQIQDEFGNAKMSLYSAAEGVQLAFLDVHRKSQNWARNIEGPTLEIHFCQQGRMEQEYNGAFAYLDAGECCAFIRTGSQTVYDFPLEHYKGMVLILDLNTSSEWMDSVLDRHRFSPQALASLLKGENGFFLFKDAAVLVHCFKSMFNSPEENRLSLWRLNILNILFFIGTHLNSQGTEERVYVTAAQSALAKEISAYMAANMDSHWTLDDLAKQFSISKSSLQDLFKKVYGTSVHAYRRMQRMQKAALQLSMTNKSIAEIAAQAGYDSQSKFSRAFKDVMDQTPLQYRRGQNLHESQVDLDAVILDSADLNLDF